MQGPPTSSPPLAPPIKKQRGDVQAQRQAQLQALKAGYANRPRMGPPPARRTMPPMGFRPRGAVNGTATATTMPSNYAQPAPPIQSHPHPMQPPPPHRQQQHQQQQQQQPPTQQQKTEPAIPNREPNFARQSDIFPQAPKAETPAVARRLEVHFTQEPPLAQEQQPPQQTPKTPATTKGVTFAETPASPASPSPSKSISSPEPVVSPPSASHPTYTPAAAAATTTNAGPRTTTPFPGQTKTTTSATPHAKVQFAGHTPHVRSNHAAGSAPPSTAHRREKLAHMRDVANTPPSKTSPEQQQQQQHKVSVELRMQKELTSETKKNAELNRKVAELEEKLTQKVVNETKTVSFAASPHRRPLDTLTPPRRRAPVTPHPKQDETVTIAAEFWEMATEECPYKFESDADMDDEHSVPAVFVVRRPYEYAGMDHQLWFAAGEVNAKLYARDATAERLESIEVAVQIAADESVLLLYNEADVRHQNAVDGTWNKYGNYFEQGMDLGTVAYIDGDANEKEYSLDKLVEQALEVRKHYCASLRGMALGLQRRAQQTPPSVPVTPLVTSNGPAETHAETPKGAPETPLATPPVAVPSPAAAAAATAVSPPRPVVSHEPQTDVFSVLIGLILSVVFSILKFPFVVLYTLVTWSGVAVLAACIYLSLLHTMETTGVAPPLYYYHNPPGIL